MADHEKQRAPNGQGKRSMVTRSRVNEVFNALAVVESAGSYSIGMRGRMDGRAFRALQKRSSEVFLAYSLIDSSELVPETLKARARSICHELNLAVQRCEPLDNRYKPVVTDSEGVTPGMNRYLEEHRASVKK